MGECVAVGGVGGGESLGQWLSGVVAMTEWAAIHGVDLCQGLLHQKLKTPEKVL